MAHYHSESEKSDYNITQNSDSSSDDDHTHSDSDDSVPISTLRSANLRGGRSRGRGRGHRGRGFRVQTEIIHHNTDVEVSSSGVSWTPGNLSVLNQPGRRPPQNILTEEAEPTSFAKRCYKGSILSAWKLIIDDSMLRHIQKCTETEARRQLEDNA
ncbi:hypothetical protein WA026_012537 [Henosepilachna vigintioctopunctata]|uniref:Uncharacterized protein n=1 Tax=Henosepilachna vigintioctopunctata TaxID=420089 RepID=A0AAW1TXC1_9CUCU